MAGVRVLHVISSIDARAGGPAQAIRGLCSAQARAGLDVSIFATWSGDAPPPADDLRAAGADVQFVGPVHRPIGWRFGLARDASQAVATADIVHIHALWEEVQHRAAVLARRLKKPYIIRACGMLDPWSLAQSRWKKRLYMLLRLRRDLDRATALHFTAEMERQLTAPLKLAAPPIVEPNGVDLAEFQSPPESGTFRRRFPQLAGRRFILFLSRVHPKKGLDLLLPAFAGMVDRSSMLVIAGPDTGAHAAEIQQLGRQLGVADRVIFTGMLAGRSRVEALVDADLFVLPSRQENFGIAVVEAMAAGRPVVISDQVNICGEIAEAGVGTVVPLDVGRLAEAMDHWMADESLRLRAGDKAAEFARSRYDWACIARRWAARYRDLLTGSSASSAPSR